MLALPIVLYFRFMHSLLRKNYEYWNHERSLSALLIYLAIALFTWIPLAEYATEWWSFIITDVLFNLIILAGIFSVLTRWRKQLFFLAVALLATVVRLLAFTTQSDRLQFLSYCLAIVFFYLLGRMVLRHIFKEGPVNFYRIQGSIVIFMMVGMVYANLYAIVEFLIPGSFASTQVGSHFAPVFSQFLYFSFVTMTTLGFGDLIPIGAFAKSLAVFQGMFGLLYPVVMIARLISMEVAHSASLREND